MDIHNSITLRDSLKLRSESIYLIISNKEKCTEILNKSELKEDDIIDFFISLHLILEVSLNSLFRLLLNKWLFLTNIKDLEIIKNFDEIDFIAKTTLFIYNSKFNFDKKLNEAEKHHSIIGELKDFSGIRNKLIHGHSIMTIIEEGKSRDSILKEKLTTKCLIIQINMFSSIMEGMRFYLDCLDSSLTPNGKEDYKKEYLSDNFLMNTVFLKKI